VLMGAPDGSPGDLFGAVDDGPTRGQSSEKGAQGEEGADLETEFCTDRLLMLGRPLPSRCDAAAATITGVDVMFAEEGPENGSFEVRVYQNCSREGKLAERKAADAEQAETDGMSHKLLTKHKIEFSSGVRDGSTYRFEFPPMPTPSGCYIALANPTGALNTYRLSGRCLWNPQGQTRHVASGNLENEIGEYSMFSTFNHSPGFAARLEFDPAQLHVSLQMQLAKVMEIKSVEPMDRVALERETNKLFQLREHLSPGDAGPPLAGVPVCSSLLKPGFVVEHHGCLGRIVGYKLEDGVVHGAIASSGTTKVSKGHSQEACRFHCGRCSMNGPSSQSGPTRCKHCQLCVVCCGKDPKCSKAPRITPAAGGALWSSAKQERPWKLCQLFSIADQLVGLHGVAEQVRLHYTLQYLDMWCCRFIF
jgi:hypothetical protein